MLASHNTMTYLPPRRRWARALARWWRCQDKDIRAQCRAGVRHLDIRVRRDSRGRWRLCHGLVDLGHSASLSLVTLISAAILSELPGEGVTLRVVLERRCARDGQEFARAIGQLAGARPGLVARAAVKRPWRDIMDPSGPPGIDDYLRPLDTARPWWRQLPSLLRALWDTPRSYAGRHPYTGGTGPCLIFRDFV